MRSLVRSGQLVVVDGVRTPFAKMGTSLASASAVELGRTVLTTVMARTGVDPATIDEVIVGNVSQPADAANIARVIALRSGVPEHVPAFTVQRNCASGLEALTTAATRAAAGQGETFLVAGVESMTNIPLLYNRSATSKYARLARAKGLFQKIKGVASFRPSDFSPVIGLKLGLTDPVVNMNMGETAEVLSREFDIDRETQDAFALASHQKATASKELLLEEMTPFYPPRGGEPALGDNGVREEQTMEALAKLKPVFDRKTGTVTAGNASQITDGACAMLVMSERRASRLGIEPLGRLVDFHYSGCAPERMGLGPANALAAIALRTGIRPEKVDLVEINEAFAAQVLAVQKRFADASFCEAVGASKSGLGVIPDETLNPNGGAIALGHPVGASGARLVLTALKELRRRKGRRAYVSLCIGGGQGGAALLETL